MANIKAEDLFSFSEALCKLKEGRRVGRVAWCTYCLEIVAEPFTSIKRNPRSSVIETMKCIVAIDCLNRVVPWTPTHSDLLAEDWITWESEEERLGKRNYFEVNTLEQFREQGTFMCASPFATRENKRR